ncbi:Uncharacterized protein PBTT_09170 [Plasmodiophora brassicae]
MVHIGMHQGGTGDSAPWVRPILRDLVDDVHIYRPLPMNIVDSRPAYQRLVGAAVHNDLQREIGRKVAASFVNGEASITLINNGHFTWDGDNVLDWDVRWSDIHGDAVVEMLVNAPGIVGDLPMKPKPRLLTPLQKVAAFGRARVVDLLLGVPDNKVDAGTGAHGGTDLHRCCDRSNTERTLTRLNRCAWRRDTQCTITLSLATGERGAGECQGQKPADTAWITLGLQDNMIALSPS